MSSTINPRGLTALTVHAFKLFAPVRVKGARTFAYLDTGAVGAPTIFAGALVSAFRLAVRQAVWDGLR